MKLSKLRNIMEARAAFTGTSGFYCSVAVKNEGNVRKLLDKHNLKCNVDQLHCTIMYSPDETIEDPHVPNIDEIVATVTGYDMFGHKKDTLVLRLESTELSDLHNKYKDDGAVPTYSEYHPHMTIAEEIELTDEVKSNVEKLLKELTTISFHKITFEDLVDD